MEVSKKKVLKFQSDITIYISGIFFFTEALPQTTQQLQLQMVLSKMNCWMTPQTYSLPLCPLKMTLMRSEHNYLLEEEEKSWNSLYYSLVLLHPAKSDLWLGYLAPSEQSETQGSKAYISLLTFRNLSAAFIFLSKIRGF